MPRRTMELMIPLHFRSRRFMPRRGPPRSVPTKPGITPTCHRGSSVLSYRLQLALHAFRAGFCGGVFRAVSGHPVIGEAACEAGIPPCARLVGGDDGANFF